MRRKRTMTTWIVIGWLLLAGATPTISEFSIDPSHINMNNINMIIMGIIGEGPEPFDIRFWLDYRGLSGQFLLNPDGDARGDGRPSVTLDPNTGWPVVVWAYQTGSDHDIAFSEWNGTSWSATEFLTSGTEDELDPRVFVRSNGDIWVVWWEVGATDTVYVSQRPAGSSVWGPAAPANGIGEGARRPSVAIWNDEVYVAYERDSDTPGMAQEVVVIHDDLGGGGPVTDVVGETARTDPLEPILHVEQGRLWVDWQQSDTEFGFVEADPAGGWIGPTVAASPDSSWVGAETARRQIRGAVLSSP